MCSEKGFTEKQGMTKQYISDMENYHSAISKKTTKELGKSSKFLLSVIKTKQNRHGNINS